MRLDTHRGPFVLLDDCRKEGAGPSYFFHSPEEIICARTMDDVPAALARLDAVVASGRYAAGWIAYEVASIFEPKIPLRAHTSEDEPLIWLLVTPERHCLDDQDTHTLFETGEESKVPNFHFRFDDYGVDQETYGQGFDRIADYITAGDVYQVNYTHPRRCSLRGDAFALYTALRKTQPVAFGAYIKTGEEACDHQVLSLSPELFLRRRGNRLETHPMKGTAGKQPEGDEGAIAANSEALEHLANDEKNRAENLMIVDLIRNDLSRIAKPGSVRVEDLYAIEDYPTVYQMTSKVIAECPPDLSPSGVLRAIFPCGSVTGAPKVRAMEIIHKLEPDARGVYCGAIGFFGPAGSGGAGQADWVLNVPIRTMIFDANGQGRAHVGGGIVADSTAAAEYEECRAKIRFAEAVAAKPDFHLIETMRCEDGVVAHSQNHLDRMEASAQVFGIALSRVEAEETVARFAEQYSEGLHRLRLACFLDGRFEVMAAPLEEPPAAEPLYAGLAREKVDAQSVMLRHKTSERSLYNAATKIAQSRGLADILFLNTCGHIAEGAISNVFLRKGNTYYTPRIEDGALPGVLRQTLLANRDIHLVEKSLNLADLRDADTVYLGNALRGLRPVTVHIEDIQVLPALHP